MITSPSPWFSLALSLSLSLSIYLSISISLSLSLARTLSLSQAQALSLPLPPPPSLPLSLSLSLVFSLSHTRTHFLSPFLTFSLSPAEPNSAAILDPEGAGPGDVDVSRVRPRRRPVARRAVGGEGAAAAVGDGRAGRWPGPVGVWGHRPAAAAAASLFQVCHARYIVRRPPPRRPERAGRVRRRPAGGLPTRARTGWGVTGDSEPPAPPPPPHPRPLAPRRTEPGAERAAPE